MPYYFKTIDEFYALMKNKNINLLEKVDRVPSMRKSILWRCRCGKETKSKIETLMTRETGCRSCTTKKAKGNITHQTFRKVLEAEGWIMIDGPESYKNVMSILKVKCDKGHEGATSYNRFNSGKRRCQKCAHNVMKNDIDEVHSLFKEKGLKLISKEYINNKDPLEYRCRCGNIARMSYGNLLNGQTGCIQCRFESHRKSYSHYTDLFEKHDCKLCLTEDEFKKLRVNKSTKLPFICSCGKEGYRSKHHFKINSYCRACGLAARKATSILLYGTPNPAQSQEIKDKIRDVLIEKYGCHHRKLKSIQDKANATNRDNHGGTHNLALPETRLKAFYAFAKKFSKDEQEMARLFKSVGIILNDKYQLNVELSLEARDDSNYNILDISAFQNMMTDRYGARYAMQNTELFSKAHRTAFCHKNFTFPSGRIERVQGHEPYALKDLLKDHDEDDIIVGCTDVPSFSYSFPNGKGIKEEDFEDDDSFIDACSNHIYYPDIFIPSENLIIEVKSVYTFMGEELKNTVKMQTVAESGYKSQLWVYGRKGKILERIFYYPDKARVCLR